MAGWHIGADLGIHLAAISCAYFLAHWVLVSGETAESMSLVAKDASTEEVTYDVFEAEPCPPCPVAPEGRQVECSWTSDDVFSSGFSLAEQHLDELGMFAFLPFSDRVPTALHPDAIEEHVETWIDRCLPDDAYAELACPIYPCALAFEDGFLADDCFDTIGASLVYEVEGRMGVAGEPYGTGPLLFIAAFRDVNDEAYYGHQTLKTMSAIRAYSPMLDISHPGFAEQDPGIGMQSFNVNPTRVLVNDIRHAN